jgi:hypothetical protein
VAEAEVSTVDGCVTIVLLTEALPILEDVVQYIDIHQFLPIRNISRWGYIVETSIQSNLFLLEYSRVRRSKKDFREQI